MKYTTTEEGLEQYVDNLDSIYLIVKLKNTRKRILTRMLKRLKDGKIKSIVTSSYCIYKTLTGFAFINKEEILKKDNRALIPIPIQNEIKSEYELRPALWY